MKARTSTVATDDAARLAAAGELFVFVQTTTFNLKYMLSASSASSDDRGRFALELAALMHANVVGALADEGRSLCGGGRFHRSWLGWLDDDEGVSDRLAALAPKGGEA